MEYDAQHRAELLESLRVFLQENRSWQRAATRLHIHKQTLVYRMRRVEELTSRTLSDTADVADLWLALQAAASSGLVDRCRRPGQSVAAARRSRGVRSLRRRWDLTAP
jgi:purine catabolism regulator